jgi:hypothetical protein
MLHCYGGMPLMPENPNRDLLADFKAAEREMGT